MWPQRRLFETLGAATLSGHMADDAYSHVSSSLIKQIAALAGDEELARFVPAVVVKAIREKMSA